jgi:hypothetical protein
MIDLFPGQHQFGANQIRNCGEQSTHPTAWPVATLPFITNRSGAGSIRHGIDNVSVISPAGHCHLRQVRAGGILIDSNGLIRVQHRPVDFGASAVSLGKGEV